MFPDYFTMIICTKNVLKFINKGIEEVMFNSFIAK